MSEPINQAPIPSQQKLNPMALTGFICSLAFIVLFWIPFIGWLLPIAGLVFSIIGVSQINKAQGTEKGKGLAIAGIIISAVWLLIMVVGLIFAGAVISSLIKQAH